MGQTSPDGKKGGASQSLLAWMRAEHGALADAMAAEVVGGIAEYRGLRDAGLAHEVRSHSDRHVTLMSRILGEGRPATDVELAFAREIAERRARQLVPLDALLHAFRVGLRVLWDRMIARVAGDQDGLAAALALTRSMMDYVDQVSTAAADAYLRERQRLDGEGSRLRRDLLEDLLAGRVAEDAGPHPALLLAGLDGVDRVVVCAATIRLASDDRALRRLAEGVSNEVESRIGGLVSLRHDEVIAVIPLGPIGQAQVRDGLGRVIETLREGSAIVAIAGISTAGGIGDVPRLYEEAHRAMRMIVSGAGVAMIGDGRLLDYLVAQADAGATRMIPGSVRELLERDAATDGALAQTIRALYDCDIDAVRAGARLHVHPNTVRHRARRIARATGLDPRRVSDLADLVLIVNILERFGSTP